MSDTMKAVTVGRGASPLIALGERFGIDPAKLVDVLRGTVIKPDRNGKAATNEEVAAFCIVAREYDLNPFTREIYAFSGGDKGVTAIVPIDGWTKIVNRHTNAHGESDFDGCEFDEVDGPDGKPDRITCRMYVKGRTHAICATERYTECKRNTSPWMQHPYRMLRHKAFMQAARYAFGLGGIHDEDEARDIVIREDAPTNKQVTGDIAKRLDAAKASATPTREEATPVKAEPAVIEVHDEPEQKPKTTGPDPELEKLMGGESAEAEATKRERLVGEIIEASRTTRGPFKRALASRNLTDTSWLTTDSNTLESIRSEVIG